MIHEQRQIAGVDEDVYSFGVSSLGVRIVSFCAICLHRIVENPAPSSDVPPLCHIRYVQ